MKNLFILFLGCMLGSVLATGQNCDPKTTFDPLSGTLADTRFNEINCHQYVRTALLNGGVNMDDGTFIRRPNISSDASWISEDDRFVEVCRKEYAEAISFSGIKKQPDHSVLVLSAGLFTDGMGSMAATPGVNSYVYRHGVAGALSGGGTRFEYYAVLPVISGPTALDHEDSASYQINWKDFIQSVVWSVPGNSSLSIVGSNSGSSVNLEADCGDGSGTYELVATLTIKDSGETVTLSIFITVNCGVIGNPCYGNQLNGGLLSTFNYVAPNTTHVVSMNMPWQWNLSWGNPTSWSTSNNGQTMTFALPSGSCATWNAYNSACGMNTYTFCASSGFAPTPPMSPAYVTDVTDHSRFEVYDLLSGRMIANGFMEMYGNSPQNLIQTLSNGFYAIRIDEEIRKVAVQR